MTEVILNPLHQKLLLIAAGIAVFMDALDGSAVNISLPVIAADFGTDTGTVSWVCVSYLLILAGLILTFGKLSDRGHVRIIFITGFIVFTIGSVACGFSPNLTVLIASRVFQGVGAAMIAASAPMLCVKFLPMKMLGISMGVLTAASSIGFAMGPAIGGFITAFLSWHWIFFLNIPIGIFAVLFAVKIIPQDVSGDKHAFDFAGAFTLFFMMASGIFALERLPHLGFSSPVIILAVGICVISLILFILFELKSRYPILNIRVFEKWPLTFTLLAYLILQTTTAGIFYLLPFYLSAGMNFDAAVSGLFLILPPVITAVLSISFGRWSDKTGRRGFVFAACVLLIIINVIYALIVPEWGIIPLILSLVIMGLIWGIGGGPASSRIVEQMPDGERGTGSSLMITCMYFGAGVGIALYASVFTVLTTDAGSILSFADLDYTVFMYGFHISNAIGAILAIIAVILSLVVKDPAKK